MKSPPQIILGGVMGRFIFKMIIKPVIKSKLSTRDAAARLGVSHNTISVWRRKYL